MLNLIRQYGLLLSVLVVTTGAVLVDVGLRGWHRFPSDPVWGVPQGDVLRGRRALERHGCGACHLIPGIRLATGRVGPQLTDFRAQTYIAGRLANTPANLVLWVQQPQEVQPGTAMPNLNVTEQEAFDIAAWFYQGPK